MDQFIQLYRGIEKDFDLLVLDTEFSRLPFQTEAMSDWANRVELLSVAIACLDATQSPSCLYAVRNLDRSVTGKCSDFVRQEVLPHLEAASPSIRFNERTSLKRGISSFLAKRKTTAGKPVAIAVDWTGDCLLMKSLFPKGTSFLLLEGLLPVEQAMRTFFTEDYSRHNAYHDALAILKGLSGVIQGLNIDESPSQREHVDTYSNTNLEDS